MLSEEYIEDKIDAFNIASEALRMHEDADVMYTVTPAKKKRLERAKKIREKLAAKLDRECQKWVNSIQR
jgi:hypothetical protein